MIQGLSTGVQGELDKLDKLNKRDQREERPAGQVTAGRVLRLAPRPVFLAGREELLAEVDARLSGDEDAWPRVVALCGLGGAGKTSVALEYAHRHLGEVGVAWQLPAEDPAVLAAGFGGLAAQLGAADGGDPVAVVHGVLAASPARWLLVFDNAPDRASVAPFVPPAGRGRVLITSRDQIWPSVQALEVLVLDPEVAAEFLVNRTGDPDRQAALELAGELGGLPLALEQAAAYIQATAGSLSGYLGSFRQHQDELLSRGEPTDYDKTVATTWSLALRRLDESAPGGAALLRLLAFLAPEPVPLALLLADAQVAGKLPPEVATAVGPLLGNPVAAGDAAAALRRYSLITPAGDGMVLVHRLVQHVTSAEVPAEMAIQWEQAAATLVEAAIPADPQLPAVWPVCAVLLPHARAVLDPTSGGLGRIANYLGYSGSFAAARDLWQRIVGAYREDDAYGAEHPRTLAARAHLADWTGVAGDAAGGPGPVRGAAPDPGAGAGRRGPGHPHRPPQPRPLDRGGGGCGRGPGPVRGAAPDPGAGAGRRGPGHPHHPPQPRPLDRGGGGCGRGPGPIRRAAAPP